MSKFKDALNDYAADHLEHFGCLPLDFEYRGRVFDWAQIKKHISPALIEKENQIKDAECALQD